MGDVFGELAGIAAPPRLKRAAGAVRALLRAALDLALPRLCAACREPVEGARALSGVLVEALLHHPALLRAARHSLRL